ncbi:nucleotide exchange factor GrpE [Candidatus Phytoplasma australiense]|uniref:Protein GrpE n=1 Tax=Strawberry lethal yellows phytoplasma (CPA) str. NZSb11 TaxID=980422 RepID=R4RP64_PHYAS|nr:nucleotide exchange factor GrpE [Candidatus Phytoplasma australiense]AGL90276.1 Protein grpE [Strawberry lethal yellows phytoplasma (CPA) str. NZSb11]
MLFEEKEEKNNCQACDVCDDNEKNATPTEETKKKLNSDCDCTHQDNTQTEKKPSSKTIVKLKEQINKLTLQLEEQKKAFADASLKNQAELINFKKRLQKQKIQELKYASSNLISDLLVPLEQLEKALEISTDNELLKKYLLGFQMIQQQIKNILKEEGVEEIQSLNAVFNPALHNALEKISEPEKPNKTNLKVLQKGYLYKEKILRPAMVQVNEWSNEDGKK